MSTFGLTDEERDFVFQISGLILGGVRDDHKPEIIVSNVRKRMRITEHLRFSEYMQYILSNEEEFAHFVSSLTIHTTAWFREAPHYDWFEQFLQETLPQTPNLSLRLLSAACSTGEEPYSFALIAATFQKQFPLFEYTIEGLDIDPVCIAAAEGAVFRNSSLQSVADRFLPYFKEHSVELSGGDFRLKKALYERCSFSVGNIKQLKVKSEHYDIVVCRNVLIYFNQSDIKKSIMDLAAALKPSGRLILGHSEAVNANDFGFNTVSGTIYQKMPARASRIDASSISMRREKLYIVTKLKALHRQLETMFKNIAADQQYEIETISRFEDMQTLNSSTLVVADSAELSELGVDQRAKFLKCNPRLLVICVGGSSLEPSRHFPLKNTLFLKHSELLSRRDRILEFLKVRSSTSVRSSQHPAAESEFPFDAILIGASTGGPNVLTEMLSVFGMRCPPVLVVQHISGQFHRQFAERLARASGLVMAESRSGMPLKSGHLYMALEDYHLGIQSIEGKLTLKVGKDAPLSGHRPSVDYLFHSAAAIPGRRYVGILLTGMGADGARGLSELYQAKSLTFCQKLSTCVVDSMPREALKICPHHQERSPEDIRKQLDLVLPVKLAKQVAS